MRNEILWGTVGFLSIAVLLFGQPAFTELDRFGTDLGTHGIALGDYQPDRLVDVALANAWSYYGEPNRIYTNTGGLNFSLLGSYGGNNTTRGIAWGDVDNDGMLDIAVVNDYGVSNMLYEQTSPGVFSIRNCFGGGTSFGIAWADYDNDCDLDVAVNNASGEQNVLYENIGSGNFTAHNVLGAGNPRDGTWSDYDNDGLPDYAIAMREGGIAIYHNDGGGNFSVGYSSSSPSVVGLNWGDFENDGDLDLVAATLDNSYVHIFRNNNGSFDIIQVGYKYRNSGVAWIDFDLDGDLDIAVGSYTDYEKISVFENIGDTVFAMYDISSDYVCCMSLAVGDMDNDGDLDICAPEYFNNMINKLFRNDVDGSNYIKVYLRGRAIPGYTNYYGVGAKIKVYDSNDSLVRYQEINGGMGRSMNAMHAVFGVSPSDTYTVIAEWPASGIVDTVSDVTTPRVIAIPEGGSVGVEEGATKGDVHLFKISPNPGKGAFCINYSIGVTTGVSLSIIDAAGREVNSVNLKQQEPGRHSFTWNARDSNGDPVSAGTYFVVLDNGHEQQCLKLIVVR